MNSELVQQFLTRYETADTRREKALALYNAVITAMPCSEAQAFLGEEGAGFLAFVRTLQAEDSDVSTAFAREEDAPSEEYLADLFEQVKALL